MRDRFLLLLGSSMVGFFSRYDRRIESWPIFSAFTDGVAREICEAPSISVDCWRFHSGFCPVGRRFSSSASLFLFLDFKHRVLHTLKGKAEKKRQVLLHEGIGPFFSFTRNIISPFFILLPDWNGQKMMQINGRILRSSYRQDGLHD